MGMCLFVDGVNDAVDEVFPCHSFGAPWSLVDCYRVYICKSTSNRKTSLDDRQQVHEKH